MRSASKPSPTWSSTRSSASVCTKSMCFDGQISWSTFNSKMTIKLLREHKITPVRNTYSLWEDRRVEYKMNLKIRGADHISDRMRQVDENIFVYKANMGLSSISLLIHKGDRELKEVLRLKLTRGDNPFAPFRKSPSLNSTTKRRTPLAPSARPITFRTKRLDRRCIHNLGLFLCSV